MTVGIAPDIEVIIKDYLRPLPAVAALNTRLVAQTPEEGDRDASWVRVLTVTDPDADNTGHLIEFLCQIDVYASKTGGIPQVKSIVRTIRAALAGLPGQRGTDTVNGVKWIGGPRGFDPDLKNSNNGPRDKQSVTVIVWAHG